MDFKSNDLNWLNTPNLVRLREINWLRRRPFDVSLARLFAHILYITLVWLQTNNKNSYRNNPNLRHSYSSTAQTMANWPNCHLHRN